MKKFLATEYEEDKASRIQREAKCWHGGKVLGKKIGMEVAIMGARTLQAKRVSGSLKSRTIKKGRNLCMNIHSSFICKSQKLVICKSCDVLQELRG